MNMIYDISLSLRKSWLDRDPWRNMRKNEINFCYIFSTDVLAFSLLLNSEIWAANY